MENRYCFTSDRYQVNATENGATHPCAVYIALICDGDGNNKPLPPEVFAEFDGLGMGTNAVKTYFTVVNFDESATLCVSGELLPAQSVTLKPEPKEGHQFSSGQLTMTLSESGHFVIQPDGDIFGGLHVFANKRKPKPTGYSKIIEFRAGVHTAENCDRIAEDAHGNPMVTGIENDTLIYLHEGAVVCANIELCGLSHVCVAGTGILSTVHRCHGAENNFDGQPLWGAFRYHAKPSLYIRSGCRDIVVEDVVLNSEFRCVVLRNSEAITLRGVRMFSSTENADGINCYNTSELLVDQCYIDSCDDCFCMYNACDSIPTLFDEGYENVRAVCRNVEVKNCVMCSASRPVVLGGHATGATDPRCLIENIHIHDCYIIETPKRIFVSSRERELYWSGHLRLLSQSEQLVRNICFSDIRMDITRGCISKPIHIEVRGNKNASYTESQGYRLENITFRNIAVAGHTEACLPIVIKCREAIDEKDGCGVFGVRFDNVTVNGKPVCTEEMILEGRVEDLSVHP